MAPRHWFLASAGGGGHAPQLPCHDRRNDHGGEKNEVHAVHGDALLVCARPYRRCIGDALVGESENRGEEEGEPDAHEAPRIAAPSTPRRRSAATSPPRSPSSRSSRPRRRSACPRAAS